VLRQLSTTAAGLDAVVMPERGALPLDVSWVDASGADDGELDAAARLCGLSEAVAHWLRTPGDSTRPRAIDGALVFALPLPLADADGVANNTQAITVATTGERAVTAHSGAADGVIAAASERFAASAEPRDALVAVLSLIDEITDRYDDAVDILAQNLEVHVGTVVDARHAVTPNDVVTESLRLATSISRLQRDVRRLRQIVLRMQSFVPRAGNHGSSAADATMAAVDGLGADLDSLDDRLELATDTQLNLLSARQGEINKRIGAWGGVFAVNAAITGWYGMNIGGLPGAGSWVTVAILMASVTVALILLFRRVHWL
jgi:Mg2+ and Co2+ transporter CorA